MGTLYIIHCGCLGGLPTSRFINRGRPPPSTLPQPVLQCYSSPHLAHKRVPLQVHVSIRSVPRRRGRSRIDSRSAPYFCLFYLPLPRLILYIPAPNLRERTRPHASSNSRSPDELPVDLEGTLLPAEIFPSVTQLNYKSPNMAMRPPRIGSYMGLRR